MGFLGDRFRAALMPERSVTADLYFANACASEGGLPGAGIWLSPTVYETDRATVVFRHDAGAVRRPESGKRLIYVIDDDIFSGVSDVALPRWYRLKLGLFERQSAKRLLSTADVIVASDQHILDLLPASMTARAAEQIVLAPHWSMPLAALEHFGDMATLRVAFLGSQVHRRNARFLSEVMREVLPKVSNLTFHIADSHSVPDYINRHPRVSRFPAGSWVKYRHDLSDRRFHLALYPLADDGLDRGRSANKLIEHAIYGAAGLYTEHWVKRNGLIPGRDCIALPRSLRAWSSCLIGLAERPGEILRLAVRGQRLAEAINDPRPQRAFWRSLLS